MGRLREPKVELALLGQDDRHRLRVHGLHDGIRLGGEKAVEVIRRFAFLELPYRRPGRPDPREDGERPVLAQGEPDRLFGPVGKRVVLGEARERDQAPVLDAEPAPPVRGSGVADVGDAGVRLPVLQREPGRRHAPAHHAQNPALRCVADHRRRHVREDARKWWQVAGAVLPHPGEADDGACPLPSE